MVNDERIDKLERNSALILAIMFTNSIITALETKNTTDDEELNNAIFSLRNNLDKLKLKIAISETSPLELVKEYSVVQLGLLQDKYNLNLLPLCF